MQNYRKEAALFLISQGVTLFGSSLVQFAIIWYVTLQTSSGAWVSALTIAAYVPQFIISFLSGVWADRYSRKMIIVLADSVIAMATLALALLIPYIGEGTPLLLTLAAISVVRSLGAGVQTPAVNSMIPQLVPEDKLMKFNGVNATIQSLVQFAAPAAAGTMLSFGTLQGTLMIDIATAIVGIGILSAVVVPFIKSESISSMFSDMKAGFKYAAKESFVGPLLLIFGLFIFLCVPAGFLATLFVSRYFGGTYWYLTLVEVIGFIGMTVGGLLIGAWGGCKNRVKTLVVGMTAFGVLGNRVRRGREFHHLSRSHGDIRYCIDNGADGFHDAFAGKHGTGNARQDVRPVRSDVFRFFATGHGSIWTTGGCGFHAVPYGHFRRIAAYFGDNYNAQQELLSAWTNKNASTRESGRRE